jgi:hypothetical protein
VVLAVNIWDEEKELVSAFAKEKKLQHRILLDGGNVAKEAYRLQGIPVVYWIDRSGLIVDTHFDFDGPGPLQKKTKRLLKRIG